MINVDKKERKKENRDLAEQRKLLLERLHAQKEDAFFRVLAPGREDALHEARMYDLWMLKAEDGIELSDALLAMLCRKLREEFPWVEISRYGNDLFAYPIPCDDLREMEDHLNLFTKFMIENKVPYALVHTTNSIWLENMHMVYRETTLCFNDMKVIFPRNKYYSYQHVCFTRSISLITQDEGLIATDVYLLNDLERRYPKGEPVKVLGTFYLDEGMDLSATADTLFLHRNTAKYRLNRIGTLLGLDVGDASKCQFLIMALAVYRLHRHNLEMAEKGNV